MSDDFNVRKFPTVLELMRKRALSEGSVESPVSEGGTPVGMMRFIRRLSSTAITPVGLTPPRHLGLIDEAENKEH